MAISILTTLACLVLNATAFGWQNDNPVTKSQSLWDHHFYTRSTSLSSSHTAAHHFPTATVSSAGPVLTLSSSYSMSVRTLTIFILATATPSITPTTVISFAPTRSSTWEHTAVAFNPSVIPTPTESPAFQILEDLEPVTTDSLLFFPEPGSELSTVSEITGTEENIEAFQRNLGDGLDRLPRSIEDLSIPEPWPLVVQPLVQNSSSTYDQQSSTINFETLDSSAFASATYHEEETLNSTILNTTSGLKRRWDSDDPSEPDSDVWNRCASVKRPATENRSGNASSAGLGSLFLPPLLYLFKPERKKRRRNGPSLLVDEKHGILTQPPVRPISQERLVDEVKGIYARLMMVENKCIEVDTKTPSSRHGDVPKLDNEQWQALISLHRALLHEHHDFFLALQHPSTSPAGRRLATEYALPARMWPREIQGFVELLRYHLPASSEHMLTFINLAKNMMTIMHGSFPEFENKRTECLGDSSVCRIEFADDHDDEREVWAQISRNWYKKALDTLPHTGPLCHHLAILTRRNRPRQLFLFEQALSLRQPFDLSRYSRKRCLFDPLLDPDDARKLTSDDDCYLKVYAALMEENISADFKYSLAEVLDRLDSQINDLTKSFLEQGFYMAIANCIALLGFGSQAAPMMKATLNGQPTELGELDIYAFGREAKFPGSSMFNETRELFLKTATIIFQQGDDVNTHSFLHATLAFLVYLAQFPEAIELLESKFPWENVVSTLNKQLALSETSQHRFESEEFPSSDSQPLPEDFAMRDLLWAEDYFPPGWFLRYKGNRDNYWDTDIPYFAQQRRERILWLSCRLARYRQWIIYDSERKEFTLPVTSPTVLISASKATLDTEIGSLDLDYDMSDFSSLLDWEASHTRVDMHDWTSIDTSSTYSSTDCSFQTPSADTNNTTQCDALIETSKLRSPSSVMSSLSLESNLPSYNALIPTGLQELVDATGLSIQLNHDFEAWRPSEDCCDGDNSSTSPAPEDLSQSLHHFETQVCLETIAGNDDTKIDHRIDLAAEPTWFVREDMEGEYDINKTMETSFPFIDESDHENNTLFGELPFSQCFEFLDFFPGNSLGAPFQPGTTYSNLLSLNSYHPVSQISVLHAETHVIPDAFEAEGVMKHPANNLYRPSVTTNQAGFQRGPFKGRVGDLNQSMDSTDNTRGENQPSVDSTLESLPPPPRPAPPSLPREQNRFICQYCTIPFSRKCDLNKHIAGHTRPFPCTASNCGKRFATSKDQARHLKDRHVNGERIFCRHADCAGKRVLFKRKDNMRRHWRRAHGRNPQPDEE